MAETFGICQFPPQYPVPDWYNGKESFFSLTRTRDELSIVLPEKNIPGEVKCVKTWRALKVEGILDFNLTGILSSVLKPLSDNNVSVFAISTYNTDYILVKEKDLLKTKRVLKEFFRIGED